MPIYLQDPSYVINDVESAKQHNMAIVRYGHGHQIGWTEIDRSTLVIEFALGVELYNLVNEYERPGAYFRSVKHKPLKTNSDEHVVANFIEAMHEG
jgi:hypothetical protein